MPRNIKASRTFPCNSRLAAFLLATTMLAMPTPAHAVDPLATPTGETVMGGAATFDRPFAGQLNVTQTTNRAVINWDSFNIGENATTEFFQPGKTSLAVNRVTGGIDPTEVLGTLKANGKLVVVDPNGVLFGSGAKVDAAGIVAAAGEFDTAEVMGGSPTLRIQNVNPDAIVENRGRMTAADAGLVALVAPRVRNSGIITAKFGKVAFASGSKAIVDLYGDGLISVAVDSDITRAQLDNSGKILAWGGTVQMTTRAAAATISNVVNNSGVISVSSFHKDGGKIILLGHGADVNITGAMKANSLAKTGGKIKIEGRSVDVSGSASASSLFGTGGRVDIVSQDAAGISGELKVAGKKAGGTVKIIAHDANIRETAVIDATSHWNGKGGHIELADVDVANISGTLDASGWKGGGSIQISAHELNLAPTSMLLANATMLGNGGKIDFFTGHNVNAAGQVHANGILKGGTIGIHGHDIDIGGLLSSTALGGGGKILVDAGHNVTLRGLAHADGGKTGGQVKLEGHDIMMYGTMTANALYGIGGRTDIFANHAVDVRGNMEAEGAKGGGFVEILAHTVDVGSTGSLSAQSNVKGRGGHVEIGARKVTVNGSLNANGADRGGVVQVNDAHDLTIGTGSTVSADGKNENASGGEIDFFVQHGLVSNGVVTARGQTNGGEIGYHVGHDTVINGLVSAASGATAGVGGLIHLSNGHSITANGSVIATGAYQGGKVKIGAHDIVINGDVRTDSMFGGHGGFLTLIAGHNVDIAGSATSVGAGSGGRIEVSGHDLTILDGGMVDASSTSGPGGFIDLFARHDVQIDGMANVGGADTSVGGELDAKGHNVRVGSTGVLLAEGGIGGEIFLDAKQSAVHDGTASVDGVNGGGSFKLKAKYVSAEGTATADATDDGNGGIVSLLGSITNFFSGVISAMGGPNGGDGGKVIINQPNSVTGTVDVSAPAGSDGTYTH